MNWKTYLIAALLILWTTHITNAQNNNFDVFTPMSSSLKLIKFLADAKHESDQEKAKEKIILALADMGLPFQAVATDTFRIGVDYIVLDKAKHFNHFESVNAPIWIDIIDQEEKSTLIDYYKMANKALGIRTNTTVKWGQIYTKVRTDQPSALGATIYTGRNLIQVGIGLPFAIPNLTTDLREDQQNLLVDKLEQLQDILEVIVQHIVHPDELAFYPTFDKKLTAAQRIYGLTQFWTEVKYNFAFFDQVPDLNWDQLLLEFIPIIQADQTNESYYKNLQRLCAKLKDGHTNVYMPYYLASKSDEPPLKLVNINKKAIVENVMERFATKIPIGSEILKVNDIPMPAYLQQEIIPYISSSTPYILYDNAIRNLLSGPKGTAVKIEYQKPNDPTLMVLELNRNASNLTGNWVVENQPWQWATFKTLANDVAYLSLNSFGSDRIVTAFKTYLDSIQSAKAVIIDLRKNGGGSSSNGYEILKYFTDQPFMGSTWKTRQHRASFKAWGKFNAGYQIDTTQLNDWDKQAKAYYEGQVWYSAPPDTIKPQGDIHLKMPLIVLIGHQTASAAEDFLVALSTLDGRATLIGQPTFGSTGQPLSFDLPGGGSARVCTKKDTYSNGREFVGYGIAPDILVEPTVADFIQKRDPVLEKALDLLR